MIFVLLILTSSFYGSLSVADEKNYWIYLPMYSYSQDKYAMHEQMQERFLFIYFCECDLEKSSCEFFFQTNAKPKMDEFDRISKELGKRNRLLLSGQSHRDGNWTTNVIFEQPGRRMESKIVRGLQPLVTLLKNDPKLSKLKDIVEQIQKDFPEEKDRVVHKMLIERFSGLFQRIITEVDKLTVFSSWEDHLYFSILHIFGYSIVLAICYGKTMYPNEQMPLLKYWKLANRF